HDAYAQAPKLVGKAKWKIRRHQDRVNLLFLKQIPQNSSSIDEATLSLFQLRLYRGQRQHRIDRRLAASPVQLQIVHHQMLLAAMLEEDERVGRKKPCCIEQVGIAVAGCDDQSRIGTSICSWVGHIRMKKIFLAKSRNGSKERCHGGKPRWERRRLAHLSVARFHSSGHR